MRRILLIFLCVWSFVFNSPMCSAEETFTPQHSTNNYYRLLWTPANISGLIMWYQADYNTLDTTGGTTTIASLTNLASTGSNYDAVQSTKANQCQYIANVYRTKGLIRCDGVNDFMEVPNGLGAVKNILGISLVVVYNVTVGGSDITVAEFENNNNATRFKATIKGSPSGRYDLTVCRLDADTPVTVSSTSNQSSGLGVAVFVADYDLVKGSIYLNNSAIRSATTLTGLTLGLTSNTDSTHIRLFSNGQASGEYLPADVLAMMVYTHPLTTSEINELYQYINLNYGLGL